MKKRIAAFVILLVLLGGALAEGFSPSMFLGSRGLMVLDQNQINSMGSQGEGESDSGMDVLAEYSMAILTVSDKENSPPSIIFTYDGVVYFALDMTAMFGQSTLDAKGMSQVFIDLCNAYDFDIYGFANEKEGERGFAYVKDMAQWKALLLRTGGNAKAMESFAGNMKESKEEFIEAVKTTFG